MVGLTYLSEVNSCLWEINPMSYRYFKVETPSFPTAASPIPPKDGECSVVIIYYNKLYYKKQGVTSLAIYHSTRKSLTLLRTVLAIKRTVYPYQSGLRMRAMGHSRTWQSPGIRPQTGQRWTSGWGYAIQYPWCLQLHNQKLPIRSKLNRPSKKPRSYRSIAKGHSR